MKNENGARIENWAKNGQNTKEKWKLKGDWARSKKVREGSSRVECGKYVCDLVLKF